MWDLDAILVLEDGRTFGGRGIGARGEVFGEVVFNTSMTGYQEILSDPSYCGQIVTFTAPQIGNYGTCPTDDQADRPALSGLVIRELSPAVSNHRARASLPAWLEERGVVGLSEVDTRALTRHIRERGALRGGIFSPQPAVDVETLRQRVCAWPSLEGADLASRVTCGRPRVAEAVGRANHRVALVDFGVKRGIVGALTTRGLTVDVLPASVTAETILQHRPDGLVLSNGPGDPAAVANGIETARQLIGRLPILGICLGHQILGLALGARTYKLQFGHHGGNHPVRDLSSGQVWITAQNHGFAVDEKSLPTEGVEVTHQSLFDGTLEGFWSRRWSLMAVQFHPEACPGPSDARQVFDRFLGLLEHGHAPAR